MTVLAIASVGTCLLALVFVLLQLGSERESRGLVAGVTTLLLGAAIAATRGSGSGIAWMREAERRSDAVAFSLAVPLLAMAVGVIAARRLRSTWAQTALCVAAFACILGAFDAIIMGRSSWYWEFVALVVGGVVLATVGVATALDRAATPNRRVVFGTFTAMGTFTTIGGALLTIAWVSIS